MIDFVTLSYVIKGKLFINYKMSNNKNSSIMKKNLIKVVSMLFLGSLLVTACKDNQNTNSNSNSNSNSGSSSGASS